MRRPCPSVLLSTILILASAVQLRAASLDDALLYTDCMKLAREAPEQAFEEALAWRDDNGGPAARHCVAVALIELGQPAEAAHRLELLAQELAPGEPRTGSEILGQAGQAWLAAGETARAFAAQSAALELAPGDVELLIDRSITLAGTGQFWEAIADLDRAAKLAPGHAEVLILRASAYRRVDGRDLALEDVQRALALEPGNPEGLLERGILRRLAGDRAGARRDWLKVLERAPDGPAAESARGHLEELDVKVE